MSQNDSSQPANYESQKKQLVAALAAGIAHDFNNLLTSVICQIDLALLDKTLAPQARDCLARALASAKRGAELNTKLLQFSRHSDTRPVPASPTRLVEETMFLVRRGIDRKVQIQFEAPKETIWPVRVNEGRLMQALMNLCFNARDAMAQGGELSVRMADRTLASGEARPPGRAGEFVQISVRDTGIGMTPEVMKRLFEPNFTTKEPGRNAGLGLFIANQVVTEHAGWIEVESEPGRGSTFHIFLPRATATAAATDPVVAAAGTSAALDGNEMVLIVDDEPSVRTVMQAMLVFRGYQVVEASDGAEGIERFRSGRDKIKLVLLDLQMPRLNGWDTMEKILELNPKIPVLLLSGGASDPPANGNAVLRSAGMIRKPFASIELLRAVRKALDAARSNG